MLSLAHQIPDNYKRKLIITMQTSKTYTQYLQSLLAQNKIAFKSSSEYLQDQSSLNSHQQSPPGPLQTNLQYPLCGNILSRYSRQMLLKEIGYQGQLKLSKAKVALIGSGGIGCPLGLYLAGAGFGTLGLFDSDVVDVTNLHRQVGHSTQTIGVEKTKSLKRSLTNLNPHIIINEHPFITKQTLHLLDGYDLVIDGSDNPQCRYLVNDYLMSKDRKLLSGACVGWEAQVTCYGDGVACYRCLWGDDQVSLGGCSTLGVVGMLPGFVAMILGVEAVKIVTGGKSSLEGFLLTYDARSCLFRKMKLRNKKPDCLACGENRFNIQEYDYGKYGNCSTTSSPIPQIPTITWSEAISKLKQDPSIKLVDVRPKGHYDIIRFKQSINIPYENLTKMSEAQLQDSLGSKEKPLFISCKVGITSKRASDFLIKQGYTSILNVEGGINKYGAQFDPAIVNL